MRALALCVIAGLGVLTAKSTGAEPAFRHFVTVKGDQLTEGGQPFRFVSFNIPNLHLVEDNVVFGQANAWRLPDRFEITDALEAVRQAGGTVVRTYVLSVVRTNDGPGVPRHVLGPGKFDEESFHTLDLVLEVANKKGVRVIIPFVDNWSWWGGIAEYAGFRGKPRDAFWTDPQIIADFQETVRFTINRTNALTGVPYREDKAILAWETGNELLSPPDWTRRIAAYVKSLDENHPVIDGYHTSVLRDDSLLIPEVDIVTTHHYPGGNKSFAELIRANWAKAKGKKPYFVGEFGFVDTPQMEAALDAVIQTGTAGALVWSLRYRNRDGGFYWHSEPAGGNKYKAYHWPGFESGAAYDEAGLLRLMRDKAFQIRGLSIAPLPVPSPPRLLPIQDAGAISWQGSAGATSYNIERASIAAGPWTKIAEDVSDAAVQYRPLFADTSAPKGRWFYRVRAVNSAGVSAPSNVVGPVDVTLGVLVDEMADFTLMDARSGTLELRTRDCRQTMEDGHRVAGKPAATIVYRFPGAIQSCRLYAFFPGNIGDFLFAASANGKDYAPLPSNKKDFFGGAGDYGYLRPVLFEVKEAAQDACFLKIEFKAEAQIGRIEAAFLK